MQTTRRCDDMCEPADYPSELNDEVTLPNQARVHIRALRPGEDDPVREFYAHLSLRTRYFRFFSPMPVLPDPVLHMLTAVDHCRRLALVAERERGDGFEIIGLGSYNAVDDDSAEVALVVRDDWQRQRVGTALASRVLEAAEARGFHRFVGFVHLENFAIRRLIRNLCEVISSTIDGGISELVLVRRRVTSR